MADIEAIATDVVDCAIKVHRALGPGLLESAYQHCHAYELKKRGWDAETAHETRKKAFRPQPLWERPLPSEIFPCLMMKTFAFFAPSRFKVFLEELCPTN